MIGKPCWICWIELRIERRLFKFYQQPHEKCVLERNGVRIVAPPSIENGKSVGIKAFRQIYRYGNGPVFKPTILRNPNQHFTATYGADAKLTLIGISTPYFNVIEAHERR